MKRRFLIALGLIAVIVVAALLLRAPAKRYAESLSCCNDAICITFAGRLWASDNEELFPTNFLAFTNELISPQILICPGDHSRKAATDWSSFGPENSSYEIVAPGMRSGDTNAFLRCKIHHTLGYADGTAFDGTRRRSKGEIW